MLPEDQRLKVAQIWERLFTDFDLVRVRRDQAVLARDEGKNPAEQIKIEAGYGSGTIRVRLFKGYMLVDLWDVPTGAFTDPADAQPGWQDAALERVRLNLRAKLADLGVEL